MIVIVNGENIEFEKKTVQELIEQLGLVSKVMAAAVNMNIVKQDSWGEYELSHEDKIELLDFVGGG
ncbi:MAG: sulfur carrier protein ThiS [Campylobacterota bacterium]|nr:sulfur carrier protein ThiS [Campylobacterota bacterium]